MDNFPISRIASETCVHISDVLCSHSSIFIGGINAIQVVLVSLINSAM